jgi:hypothetical protein
LFMRTTDPFTELHRVGYGGREKDIAHCMRKENDSFLPDDTTLFVTHIVNFIEDNPGDFSHDLWATVEHRPENLRTRIKERFESVAIA